MTLAELKARVDEAEEGSRAEAMASQWSRAVTATRAAEGE